MKGSLIFAFCCGPIGHQYRECIHYKSQSKDELTYGPWLKAITIADRLKQSRRKDRSNSEPTQPNTKVPVGVNTKLILITGSEKRYDLEEQGKEEGLNQVRTDSGLNTFLPERQTDRSEILVVSAHSPFGHGRVCKKIKESLS